MFCILNRKARHTGHYYWIVVLSMAELYGGCVPFAFSFFLQGAEQATKSWLPDDNEGDNDDWKR